MVTRMKEYEEYEQFRDEILELVSMIIRKSQRSRKEEYSPVITRVIEYVNENYTKDIFFWRSVRKLQNPVIRI